ncbi:MAG: hypothetical protein ACE5GX_07255 [Thermoanaerobaculia bacterium]
MKKTAIAVAAGLACALTGNAAANLPPLNLDDAIIAQQKLIAKHPHNAALYNDLGNLLYLDHRMGEAEAAYTEGLRLDPEQIAVRYNLALLLHESDRPRRAERELRKVVKQSPGHAWGHYQLGVALADRGRRGPAIQSFARSMRLDPRLTDPAFNPHIVENALASSAVLWAYSGLSPASLAPRVYENPEHVTTILLAAQAGKQSPERKVNRQLRREERRRARQAESDN